MEDTQMQFSYDQELDLPFQNALLFSPLQTPTFPQPINYIS
jgi:hypothetical protein